MIVIVSTKTLRAREPDHSARMKPIDTTSYRPPPLRTSLSVGLMMLSTVWGVSACPAMSRTVWRTSSIWLSLNRSKM